MLISMNLVIFCGPLHLRLVPGKVLYLEICLRYEFGYELLFSLVHLPIERVEVERSWLSSSTK